MSGISASQSGLQTSALSMAVAAQNVANANNPGFKARRLDQETTAQGDVRATAVQDSQEAVVPGGSNVDLAREAVGFTGAKVTYEANLRFLQSQDALLGMAMDMKA